LEVFAESLRIVLKLNQVEPVRVFYAQKAVSSHHHRDREKKSRLERNAFRFSEQP
jgi:hypothetical protein